MVVQIHPTVYHGSFWHNGSYEPTSSSLVVTYISSPKGGTLYRLFYCKEGLYVEKRIETVELPVSQIKTGFGNPRKITKKKQEELERSLKELGNFGIFVIDEDDNIIAGNQRMKIIKDIDSEAIVTCKRLIGYTEAEKRAINIKDNTHSGEWDLDLLADWTADLEVDLGIKPKEVDPNQRTIPGMELIHYEKYDYVLIACRSELDYNDLIRRLGIEGAKVQIAKHRKIKARAIWYDQMKATIVPNTDM